MRMFYIIAHVEVCVCFCIIHHHKQHLKELLQVRNSNCPRSNPACPRARFHTSAVFVGLKQNKDGLGSFPSALSEAFVCGANAKRTQGSCGGGLLAFSIQKLKCFKQSICYLWQLSKKQLLYNYLISFRNHGNTYAH